MGIDYPSLHEVAAYTGAAAMGLSIPTSPD